MANAGGMNPRGCADALRRVMREAGVEMRIAVVEGDQVQPQLEGRRETIREMFSGAPLPRKLMSANAYLGALPIAAALGAGAQIVITGRCVDSALALGPLMHEFGWKADDYDRLAAGSIVGHLLECGTQATGGVHTDWQDISVWADIGYPIAECASDGSFVLTKAEGTGGRVSIGTVAEQLLYEIGDPSAYVLPDVVCDLTHIELQELGKDRVRLHGVKGLPPTPDYKVTATFQDGWRCVGRMISIGPHAQAKAQIAAETVLERTRGLFRKYGLLNYRRTNVEILGAETIYGPHARAGPVREVMLRLAVEHDDRKALEIFSREMAPSSITTTPAFLGGGDAGRPKLTPIVRSWSCLLPKPDVEVTLDMDGTVSTITTPLGQPLSILATACKYTVAAPRSSDDSTPQLSPSLRGEGSLLPLFALAWARSGDKGDNSNIAVIARHPLLLPLLLEQLTAERLRDYFAHLVKGTVTRYEVPGIHALNFVMTEALDGGGMASIRYDTLGKGMAQMLLDVELQVPFDLVAHCHPVEPLACDSKSLAKPFEGKL